MPVTDLLLEGVELMVLGMGTVFTFLILLVVVMMGMSRFARIFDSGDASVESALTTAAGPISPEDQELAAVIAAAIKQYRAKHRY